MLLNKANHLLKMTPIKQNLGGKLRPIIKKELSLCYIKLTIMPFSDLFSSEFNQRNRGKFSAVVNVAYANGHISEEERKFLDKLAIDLEISKEEYEEILKDPTKYPINPPYLYIERLEALYTLSRIVHRDHQLGDKQEHLLTKFAVALGFTPSNASYIVHKALTLVDKKVDLDTFIYEMKNMYK